MVKLYLPTTTGIQIAEACEVEFELNYKDNKSITSDCWKEAVCKPHKDLKQTFHEPYEMDVNIPIEDDFKLRMVSLVSGGIRLFPMNILYGGNNS